MIMVRSAPSSWLGGFRDGDTDPKSTVRGSAFDKGRQLWIALVNRLFLPGATARH
jgi:hypothetical protein